MFFHSMLSRPPVTPAAAVRRRGSLSEIFRTVKTRLQRDRSSTESSHGTFDSLFSDSLDDSSSTTEETSPFRNGFSPFPTAPALRLLPAIPGQTPDDTLCSALEKAGFGKFDIEEPDNKPAAQTLGVVSKPPPRASLFKLRWDRRSKSRGSEFSLADPKSSQRAGHVEARPNSLSSKDSVDLDRFSLQPFGLQRDDSQASRVPASFVDKVLEESIPMRSPHVSKLKAAGRRRTIERSPNETRQQHKLSEFATQEHDIQTHACHPSDASSGPSLAETDDDCSSQVSLSEQEDTPSADDYTLSVPGSTRVCGDVHPRPLSTVSEVSSCEATIDSLECCEAEGQSDKMPSSGLQTTSAGPALLKDDSEEASYRNIMRVIAAPASTAGRASIVAGPHSIGEQISTFRRGDRGTGSEDQSDTSSYGSQDAQSQSTSVMDVCDGHWL
ncbi:uncharacterized protein F5Z01DRAFT_685469 [Emericellopsis atlantica]|uniref:Uncharacterized protein n=1 Tax=Emericellopsis atlantica TaxID=2614577 RepID=A0A9P8CQC7_9HYPO|nr:uncharacterized protein F5Z01DRAFT_685469 [Emericellopsis atlantica]KAG9255177.1 hypothetical protein F5Z01DRAFT_685469 [Emericellopsis atlantica]